jgi:predicted nucleic acid-binding protein
MYTLRRTVSRVPDGGVYLADNLSWLLTYPGIFNSDKAVLLKALKLFLHSGTDIVDGILAAASSKHSLIVSSDSDFRKLKVSIVTL